MSDFAFVSFDTLEPQFGAHDLPLIRRSWEVVMRLSVMSFVLTAFLISNSTARAEDCKSLPVQSEQIACLQREIELLRNEVEQLRSGDATLKRWIDDRIKSALADLEPKVQLLGK